MKFFPKHHHAILLLLLALSLQCANGQDVAAAEQLLRAGKPAEALQELQLAPTTPAVLYWKGRTLVELNRLPQAATQFKEVPQDSVFYPYAAKAMIYCAWQSPVLDFVEYVAPLTAVSHPEVATLAQAALAEHQLRYTTSGDASTLEPLRDMATRHKELLPIVELLNIEEMRRNGQYDRAIEAGRVMESNPAVPLIMKQRTRLALAEVYYDKTAAAPPAETTGDDEDDDVESDEGKGEETLLQFIAANPDSPLLDEVFRRLNAHKAFEESEYARRRLTEWSTELTQPHRAALAMAVLQRLQLHGENHEANDVTLANTAATQLPNEPVSQLIIGEQVRRLINSGDTKQAGLYLNMMKQDDTNPRYLFYKACCSPYNAPQTAELFLRSAELASSELQSAALCNAMYCAVISENQPMIDKLLAKELPPRVRRAMLLMHAGLILQRNPEQARAEIESAQLLHPTPEEEVEIALQLAEIDAQTNPAGTLERLQQFTATQRKEWDSEQALRYYALQQHATEKLYLSGEDVPEPTEQLRQSVATTEREDVRYTLTINLAHRLSEQGKHTEALHLLRELADSSTEPQKRARALLLCGRQAEQLKSIEQITRAAEYFAEAAELQSPYRYKALMLQARVLAWINRGKEANAILTGLLRQPDLTVPERALALSILAHEQALRGTPEGIEESIATNNSIFELGELPPAWETRARLQRATLLARAHKKAEATAEYLTLIEGVANSPTAQNPTDEEWFVLYFAASGAIAQHMQQKQYHEAATLADRIAAWPEPPPYGSGKTGLGKRAGQFANWAANIRKFNFLTDEPATTQQP